MVSPTSGENMNLQAKLSKRQEQVAGYLASGYTKKEIAHHLAISARTVENTARNIYEKTEVRSVGQLAAWWFCKTFNISNEVLPTISFPKIKALACVFLSLVVLNEVFMDSDFVRQASCKVAKAKKGRRNNEEEDNSTTIYSV